MNDGYAPLPVPGLPLIPARLRRSLGFGFLGEGGGIVNDDQDDDVGEDDQDDGARGNLAGGGWDGPLLGDYGPTRRRRTSEDVKRMWGKFLALSVDIPQGLCLGESGSGCSRVWMYGSEAWGALRERCREGLAAEAARARQAQRPGEVGGPLEVACAVGDVAGRKGGEWGLEARHVCGAGPRGSFEGGGDGGGEAGSTRWERARVWEVYPPQRGG